MFVRLDQRTSSDDKGDKEKRDGWKKGQKT